MGKISSPAREEHVSLFGIFRSKKMISVTTETLSSLFSHHLRAASKLSIQPPAGGFVECFIIVSKNYIQPTKTKNGKLRKLMFEKNTKMFNDKLPSIKDLV